MFQYINFFTISLVLIVHCHYRCIDDYSRKIIWLKAASSNHRPGIIAKYFVDTAEQIGGVSE